MTPRIQLIESKDHRFHSGAPGMWSIRDALNEAKIGHLSLSSEFELFIEIYPKYRRRGIATESLCLFNDLLAQKSIPRVTTNITAANAIAIQLFLLYSNYKESGDHLKFSWSPKSLDQSWEHIFKNKIRLNGFESFEISLPLFALSTHLEFVETDLFDRPAFLHPQAKYYWKKMQAHAMCDGVSLQIISAYRDYDYQANLIQNKLDNGISRDEIVKVNALPGYSEHHSGCAIDIGNQQSAVLEEEFENSEAYSWLNKNANDYGFYLSYPKNNKSGVIYEPWHWCYQHTSI